jgi:hypothetical protein
VKRLLAKKFKLISVPDILPARIIESCGMTTRGDRTQVNGTDYAPVKDVSASDLSTRNFLACFYFPHFFSSQYQDRVLTPVFTTFIIPSNLNEWCVVGLVCNTVSISDYIASNNRIIGE